MIDNLNTHTISFLYASFALDGAFHLSQGLKYIIRQHSNIAEIELSVIPAHCLGQRRIADIETLNKELVTGHSMRNLSQKGADWHFSTADTRSSLRRLYPRKSFMKSVNYDLAFQERDSLIPPAISAKTL